jgi:hypothetical protein
MLAPPKKPYRPNPTAIHHQTPCPQLILVSESLCAPRHTRQHTILKSFPTVCRCVFQTSLTSTKHPPQCNLQDTINSQPMSHKTEPPYTHLPNQPPPTNINCVTHTGCPTALPLSHCTIQPTLINLEWNNQHMTLKQQPRVPPHRKSLRWCYHGHQLQTSLQITMENIQAGVGGGGKWEEGGGVWGGWVGFVEWLLGWVGEWDFSLVCGWWGGV